MTLTGTEYTYNNQNVPVYESTHQSQILSTTMAGRYGQKYFHNIFPHIIIYKYLTQYSIH